MLLVWRRMILRVGVGALVGFVGLAAMGCAATAGSGADESSAADSLPQKTYLAIGDSVAFAWDPTLPKTNGQVIASSYKGYADLIGQRLDLHVDNSACPGEASGSFLDKTAEDNGCRANRAAYKLHTDWGGADTQMDFVVSYLKSAIAAGNPPELITMSIGGNDGLLLQKDCAAWGFAASGCDLVKLPFAVHNYRDHLDTILKTIDGTGWRGTMVLVTTHAPDYSDAIANFGLTHFNEEMQKAIADTQKGLGMKVVIADAFGAFKEKANAFGGKTCETGLLIKLPDGTCDIHPSAAGHQLIADQIEKAFAGK